MGTFKAAVIWPNGKVKGYKVFTSDGTTWTQTAVRDLADTTVGGHSLHAISPPGRDRFQGPRHSDGAPARDRPIRQVRSNHSCHRDQSYGVRIIQGVVLDCENPRIYANSPWRVVQVWARL